MKLKTAFKIYELHERLKVKLKIDDTVRST